MRVIRFSHGEPVDTEQPVVTEVPCTIVCNEIEVGTLLCSPDRLKDLAAGFLFSSAFITGIDEIHDMVVDSVRWVVSCTLARTPDPALMQKRMYTPGCGKGIVYAGLAETGLRRQLISGLVISSDRLKALAGWLQHCSALYRETGGVHTAALSVGGELPEEHIDDIGRHNAVDKSIGAWLRAGRDFSNAVLITSGRCSSEILHKARRAGIAIVVSRGAPTHQSVLRAGETGITLIGFARINGFTVYAHKERITFDHL
jgi:FdhD protein